MEAFERYLRVLVVIVLIACVVGFILDILYR